MLLAGVEIVIVDAEADVVAEVITDAGTGVPAGVIQPLANRVLIVAQAVTLPPVDTGACADVPVRAEVEVPVHAGGPAVQLGFAVGHYRLAVEHIFRVNIAQIVVAHFHAECDRRVQRPTIAAIEPITGCLIVIGSVVDGSLTHVAADEPATVLGGD